MKESTEVRPRKPGEGAYPDEGRSVPDEAHNLCLLRGVVLMAVFLALAWMFMDAGRPAQARGGAVVHRETGAKRFVLVDEKGKSRAILGMNKDGPGLALLDEKGNVRVSWV